MHTRITSNEQSGCEEAEVQPWLVWQGHLWECVLALLDWENCWECVVRCVRFYQPDWKILGDRCSGHMGVDAPEGTRTSEAVK